MFSPVACSKCGKPFQVPEASLGKPSTCPWCQATVTALPVGGPAPEPQPEPLPLDDEPPERQRPAAAPQSKRLWWVAGVVGLFALVIAAGVTIGVQRHKQGHLMSREWQAFTPPDGSFSVDLLGKATEVSATTAGEKRFTSEGWYSGTVAWVGWRDLTQVQVQLAGTKDAWQHFRPTFDAETDRLKVRYNGTVTKAATTKFEDPLTHEVRLEAPDGVRVAERMMVLPNGPRPRVYFVGVAGKFEADSPEVQRLFDSFRAAE